LFRCPFFHKSRSRRPIRNPLSKKKRRYVYRRRSPPLHLLSRSVTRVTRLERPLASRRDQNERKKHRKGAFEGARRMPFVIARRIAFVSISCKGGPVATLTGHLFFLLFFLSPPRLRTSAPPQPNLSLFSLSLSLNRVACPQNRRDPSFRSPSPSTAPSSKQSGRSSRRRRATTTRTRRARALSRSRTRGTRRGSSRSCLAPRPTPSGS